MALPPDPARFEDQLARLEALARKLESDTLDLDGALDAFEEGMALAHACQQRLDRAERRVLEIRRGVDGETQTVPFAPGETTR